MVRAREMQQRAGQGLAPWQVDLALRLLLRDLCANRSGAELARLCGLSRSHFVKAFKISTGLPPHRWLVRQRLRRAREMLESGNESISLIALACGFSDQSHLTRMFRAAVGASPAAWRRWKAREKGKTVLLTPVPFARLARPGAAERATQAG